MTARKPALDVDALAQEIRRVDGSHSLGAGALAEALMPYLTTAAGVEDENLEKNVSFLLERCPYAVRDLSGDRTSSRGVEDLAGSLAITFLGMQHDLTKLRADAAVGKLTPETRQPQLARPDMGLSLEQEPKYTVNGRAIVNRATGEAIPFDEPVFVFRAKDPRALHALYSYEAVITEPTHRAAVFGRINHFRRFAEAHPERMAEPDTAAAPTH